MTGFDQRLQDLLEKVLARAERQGIQWRKADSGVYAFRAGSYVVAFSKDVDPLLSLYDENGEELEAIDKADLEGREASDGRSLKQIRDRIWRLGRRGAGGTAEALDKVLQWLDSTAPAEAPAAPEAPEPEPAPSPVTAFGAVGDSGLTPQAPQSGFSEAVEAVTEESAKEEESEAEEDKPAAPNGSSSRPPWAQ